MWHYLCAFILCLSNFGSSNCFEKLTIFFSLPFRPGGWEGHHAVNSSLTRGLSTLNINYNINPNNIDDIGDVVYIPANLEALKTAIELKKNKRIKLLIAGPNMVVLPQEQDGVITNPNIDQTIVPSEWVKTLYEQQSPQLKNKISIWPAGVDTSFWQPSNDFHNNKNVLIYYKTKNQPLLHATTQLLQKYGWNPCILNYGNYHANDYKKLLDNSCFALFLSQSESQGIALAECWSMDVPTLVLEPHEPFKYKHTTWWPVSAAPYLTPATGEFWHNISELEDLLKNIEIILARVQPRPWVKEHMSDQVSAQLLINIIEQVECNLAKQMIEQ